jgi:ketopantoate reductase
MFNKIFILGAGAIGSVLGGLLSEKNDVTLIGNKAHVDAINSNGLSVLGDVTASFDVPADIKIRKIPERTLIFLTTKAYDSEKAMKKVRRLLKKDTSYRMVLETKRLLKTLLAMRPKSLEASQPWRRSFSSLEK